MGIPPTYKKVLLFTNIAIIIFGCNYPQNNLKTINPTKDGTTDRPVEQIYTNTNETFHSNLPMVTLEGGTGYLFAGQRISKDDRDIWWNAYELIPDTYCRIIPLGKITNLNAVNEINIPKTTMPAIEAIVGEGYGLEIDCMDQPSYAIISILSIDDQRRITFDWIYPFHGKIILTSE